MFYLCLYVCIFWSSPAEAKRNASALSQGLHEALAELTGSLYGSPSVNERRLSIPGDNTEATEQEPELEGQTSVKVGGTRLNALVSDLYAGIANTEEWQGTQVHGDCSL